MEPITIDLTDEDFGLQALAPGNYPVRLDEIERKTASTGKPMLTFVLVVMEPEEAAGRKLFLNCVLTTNAQWKLVETVVALGGDKEEMRREKQIKFDPGDWIGEEAIAVVTTRLHKRAGDTEAQLVNDVNRLLPVGAEVSTAAGESLF